MIVMSSSIVHVDRGHAPSCRRFGAAGDEHGKWIAGKPSADANRDVASGPRSSATLEILILESQPAIAHAIANPRLIVLAKIEHQQLAARPQNARRPRPPRAPDRPHDAAPARAAQCRRSRSSIGSFSISPRFQVMFFTPRRSASALARFSTSGERSMPMTRLAQRAASTERYPSPQAMIGDVDRRQQQPKCAGPCGPAPPRDELRPVGAVHVEIFFAQADHLLQPRVVAAGGRRWWRLLQTAPAASVQSPPNPPSSSAGESR